MERAASWYEQSNFKRLANVKADISFEEFVTNQLKIRSRFSFIYKFSLTVISGLLILVSFSRYQVVGFSDELGIQLGLGILFGLFLIPVHEYVHGFYLKYLNCHQVNFEWDIFRLRFGCYTDKFVLTHQEYIKLLLAPAIVITSLLILFSFLFSQFSIIFLAMMLIHSTLCSGDFALLTYVSLFAADQVFVYYDQDAQETIFLTRK